MPLTAWPAEGTIFFLYLVAHDKGTSVALTSKVLPNINIPIIEQIPIIGPAISGHNVLTYLSILAVVFTYLLLKKTSLGYHIRAVGEKKEAADSVGISVMKTQAAALLISGAMERPWRSFYVHGLCILVLQRYGQRPRMDCLGS